MDFSDSMMGIVRKEFPQAEIVTDLFQGNIFSKTKDRKKAKKALHKWYKNVGKTRIKEIISVRDTIKSKEEYILNYFNNRATNASAESFNSKVKGLRAQVHGGNDLKIDPPTITGKRTFYSYE